MASIHLRRYRLRLDRALAGCMTALIPLLLACFVAWGQEFALDQLFFAGSGEVCGAAGRAVLSAWLTGGFHRSSNTGLEKEQ